MVNLWVVKESDAFVKEKMEMASGNCPWETTGQNKEMILAKEHKDSDCYLRDMWMNYKMNVKITIMTLLKKSENSTKYKHPTGGILW